MRLLGRTDSLVKLERQLADPELKMNDNEVYSIIVSDTVKKQYSKLMQYV